VQFGANAVPNKLTHYAEAVGFDYLLYGGPDITYGIADLSRLDALLQRLTRYLEQFQERLTAAGGEYFADKRLTVADLKIFMWIRWLRSGVLDHIPKDLVDRVAPLLVQHFERVASHPRVAEYYKRRKAA